MKKHSENIFIHSDNIRLGDFGLSKSMIVDTVTSFSKTYGSMRYSDPRFLYDPENYTRTEASDVYSVGMLMWEISSGRLPYQSSGATFALASKIINGHRESIVPGTPKSYIDIYTGI